MPGGTCPTDGDRPRVALKLRQLLADVGGSALIECDDDGNFTEGLTKETTVDATGPDDVQQAALEFMADAVVTLDLTGKITSWNSAAQSLLGFAPENMVGGSMVPVIPEEFRARHVAGFHAATRSGKLKHEGWAGHVRATTADGRVVDLAMTLGLLRQADGTVSGAVAVLRPLVDVQPFA